MDIIKFNEQCHDSRNIPTHTPFIAPDSNSKSNPTDIRELLHLADTSLYNMYIMYLNLENTI